MSDSVTFNVFCGFIVVIVVAFVLFDRDFSCCNNDLVDELTPSTEDESSSDSNEVGEDAGIFRCLGAMVCCCRCRCYCYCYWCVVCFI